LNLNYGFIDDNNILKSSNDAYFDISDFDSADVWLIKIDEIYHNIIKVDDGYLKINSDYSFEFKLNHFEYKVASVITKVSFLVDYDNPPKRFEIFKLKFTEIKDFDNNIIDTKYSRYEYEKSDETTDTDEPKIYMENTLSESSPKELDEFIYNDELINIPVSSEYTANYETFKNR